MSLKRTDEGGRRWPHGLPHVATQAQTLAATQGQALAATQGQGGGPSDNNVLVVANCHTISGSFSSEDCKHAIRGNSPDAKTAEKRECMGRVLANISRAWQGDGATSMIRPIPATFEFLVCGDFNLEREDADHAMAEADVSPSTSRDGQARLVCVPKEAILPSTNALERDFGMSSATVQCPCEGRHRRRTTANTGR